MTAYDEPTSGLGWFRRHSECSAARIRLVVIESYTRACRTASILQKAIIKWITPLCQIIIVGQNTRVIVAEDDIVRCISIFDDLEKFVCKGFVSGAPLTPIAEVANDILTISDTLRAFLARVKGVREIIKYFTTSIAHQALRR